MDEELYLEISDDFKLIEYFDVEQDYKEYHGDKRLNKLQASVYCNGKTVAFLRCTLFFDAEIYDSGDSLFSVADDELTDDACEAMEVLGKMKRKRQPQAYLDKST